MKLMYITMYASILQYLPACYELISRQTRAIMQYWYGKGSQITNWSELYSGI
jgi:hypothetical protein